MRQTAFYKLFVMYYYLITLNFVLKLYFEQKLLTVSTIKKKTYLFQKLTEHHFL